MEEKIRDEAAGQRRRRADRVLLLGQMAAGIAHDAGNQLTLVQGALGLKAAGAEDEELRSALEAAQRAVDTTAELLREIQAFLRPVKNRPRETCYGDDEIRRMLPLLKAALGGQMALEVLPEGEDLAVTMGAAALQNVLLNLLINARNALEGRGCVRVRTWGETDAWCMAVEDDGPGIPPERRESVFEPYYTTSGQGHGLGLMRCRLLAEQAGGRIEAGESPRGGACFTVRLPLSRSEGARQGTERLCPGRGLVGVMAAGERQALLSALVRALGYAPRQAGSLMELRTMGPVRAVILDEPWTLRTYLAAVPADCPVLLLCPAGSRLAAERRLLFPVTQPVTLARLSQALARALEEGAQLSFIP